MRHSNLYALVMAGGHGTRFWPESIRSKPKQYLKLLSDDSLLLQTWKRFEGLVGVDRRYLVTTSDQHDMALESSKKMLKSSNIILEPAGRNTAPCILLSLAQLIENGARDEDVVAIVPADHVILDQAGFQETLHHAFEMAMVQSSIVTIGIEPHCAHTGYGYIQKGEAKSLHGYEVQKFVEKPNEQVATEYLKSGQYFWNAGMFVTRIDVLLEEFKNCAPELFDQFYDLRQSLKDSSKLKETYQSLAKISIDYAVMEKSKRILVTKALFDWSDLGSWDALEEYYQKIHPVEHENFELNCLGLHAQESKGNLVWAPDMVVSLIGVDDLAVIISDKRVLVMKKEMAQKVKNTVDFFSTHPKFKDYV
jgi:mannose-1-phosphate guanylyltransferase